ncbi:MAG: hypothetical protein AVDCRST_MAG88-2384 [uncultured Thermomicrobiales bacterium]|uniref:Integrase catalytic domain-containing protein n=1 Tax=uncultured Thermomicrobiales bacterium TaxID=1645740 RepID=A0A6J4V8F7_9BACT|nr:MAG: hypothetical protein AVDCRST_MAG88-2384 [uncultured Thermomicrobiales bacterium]
MWAPRPGSRGPKAIHRPRWPVHCRGVSGAAGDARHRLLDEPARGIPGQCDGRARRRARLADAPAWPTRASARRALFEWIEVWYHRQRRHSALAYQAPITWEELLMLQDQAA